ncbi:hypothetical protein ACQ4PT_060871 [Festuca glaucescens]
MANLPRTDWSSNGSASVHQAAAHQEDIGALDLNEMPFDLNQHAGFIPPNYFTELLEGGDDDASSQPNEPYVGMRFDKLQEAKDHYNAYASRIEKPVDVGPVPDPVPLDDIDIEAAEIASVIAELDEQNPNKRKPLKREMMGVMSEFYGTELLVPYTSKTITNYCATLKTETKEGDMAQVLNYFNEQKEKDPDFYCRYKLDVEDRVENLFWVDGAVQRTYAEAYHDCVSFDATYLTNKYIMPSAPFIGINRHGQSFMLGCGFVRQELAASYDWLFESFLIAMNGLAPDNIITYQDGAMKVS